MPGGGAVQPDGGGGRLEEWHGLRQEPARHSRQDIARARRGEPWRQILGYAGQALRMRGHRIGAFQMTAAPLNAAAARARPSFESDCKAATSEGKV